MRKRNALFLAFCAGALGALGMAPFQALPALVLSLSVCAFLFVRGTVLLLFKLGYVFGLGYYTAGLWWISNAILTKLDQFWWAWPLAFIGLPAVLALYPALTFKYTHKFTQNLPTTARWCAFTCALMLAELARSVLFTGFPWNLFGMVWLSNIGLPVAQSASLIGIYGLSFFTILLCAAPALFYCAPRKHALIISSLLCAVLVGFYAFGYTRLQEPVSNTPTDLAIIQPNIAVTDTFNTDRTKAKLTDAIDLTSKALNQNPRSLVIWPETMVNVYMLEAFPAEMQRLKTLLVQHPQAHFLTGYFYESAGPSFHNAIATWDRKTNTPTPVYSKFHLVPFGEYIPFAEMLPITPVTGYAGFKAGDGLSTLTLPGIPAFRPLICYEIIFPQYGDRRNAEWIITVADDSWYRNSNGPYQHLSMARMRAIEQGLPVVRATSNGVSALIDPYGRMIASVPYGTKGTIQAQLPRPRTRIDTPY